MLSSVISGLQADADRCVDARRLHTGRSGNERSVCAREKVKSFCTTDCVGSRHPT
jgi:hypothetical protein